MNDRKLTTVLILMFALSLGADSVFAQGKAKSESKSQVESKSDDKGSKKTKPKKPKSKVEKLFDSMHAQTYREVSFPKLDWTDIPELLKRTKSVHDLVTYPCNPLSSQAQRGCKEGVVAAWLIEGIRAGGRYPSLNPVCDDGSKPIDVDQLSQFYRDWWKKVKDLKPEKAKRANPLANTDWIWR